MFLRRFEFLHVPGAVLLNLVLLLQGVGYYTLSRKEETPLVIPLNQLFHHMSEWAIIQDVDLDPESMRILEPDDYVIRLYSNSQDNLVASLFVAYFRSQRTDHAPHSPKNCLPGSGWIPVRKDLLTIPLSGGASSISVNRFVVSRGAEKSLVLYWYQTATGAIASEYEARLGLVLDSIRYNRSDTALVRVTVPLTGENETATEKSAAGFARLVYSALHGAIAVN